MSEDKFLGKKHSLKLPADFKTGLRAKLEKVEIEDAPHETEKPAEKQSNFRKFALVASMLFCLLIGYASGTLNHIDTGVKETESKIISGVKALKTVPVKIEFDSPADFEDVEFEIEIPDRVSFVSDDPEIEDKKIFSWIGNLKEGVNVIPFLVKGESDEKANIFARIRKDGTTRSAKVTIQFDNKEL